MVGGKGGVGKTTCASALALGFADRGRKVLLISSDPTPSLSDIFEKEIGSRERKILEREELYGLEISSEIVLQKWKESFGDEIYEVISSFANVDYDFVDYIGTAPGIEEEYMLYFILELVEGRGVRSRRMGHGAGRAHAPSSAASPPFSESSGSGHEVLHEYVQLHRAFQRHGETEIVEEDAAGDYKQLGRPCRGVLLNSYRIRGQPATCL